jgi:hypothetical protein
MGKQPQRNRIIRRRRAAADESRFYIDKEEYNREVINFSKTNKASERLGELFILHVDKYASSSCFKGYTYLDEMKAHARLFLLKYSSSFKPDYAKKNGKKPNAFAYCTTIIHHAFLQIIQREKKHSALKDKIIKNQERINHELERFSILNQITLDD